MIYIINCDVTEAYYMSTKTTTTKNHIVEAESKEDAMDKLDEYYNMSNVEYHVQYSVSVHYCNELIK